MKSAVLLMSLLLATGLLPMRVGYPAEGDKAIRSKYPHSQINLRGDYTYVISEREPLSILEVHDDPNPNLLLEIMEGANYPAGASLPYVSGYSFIQTQFDWTPSYCQAGQYDVRVNKFTNYLHVDYDRFNVTVNNINRSPFFESSAIEDTIPFLGSLQLFPTAHDSDCIQCGDDTLYMSYTADPPSASIVFADLGLGVSSFLWTPNASEHGDYTITFKATDRFGATDTKQILAQVYVCGDANSDATVDISDAVYLIAYIFSGGSAPSPLLAGDANCDLAVDISDVVYLIAYIFSGGSAPCTTCT